MMHRHLRIWMFAWGQVFGPDGITVRRKLELTRGCLDTHQIVNVLILWEMVEAERSLTGALVDIVIFYAPEGIIVRLFVFLSCETQT